MVSISKVPSAFPQFFSDDAIQLGGLAPGMTPTPRRRRFSAQAATSSFGIMLPLSMLAACGGGMGGGVPTPTPTPTPAGAFTGVADVIATQAVAGGAAVTVAAPGVLVNDTISGGTGFVSSAGLVGGAPAVAVLTGGTVVIAGTYGSLTIGSTGSLSYIAANTGAAQRLGNGATGQDVFNYAGAVTGTSATGASTVTFTTVGINDAPVAVADTATASRGGAAVTTTAATGVLANDTDPDAGTALTVTGVGTTAALTGTLGQAVVGSFGSLTLNANGSYSYTPSAGAAGGTDVFNYRASDGTLTSTTTLTFTVAAPANLPPVGVADVASAVRGGAAVTTTAATGVLANDTDPNPGTTLTVTGVIAGAGTTFVTVPPGGTTQIPGGSGLGSLTLGSNGAYTFTPSAGTTGGTEVFSYQVSDGALTATTTLTVTVSAGASPTLGATLDLTTQTTGAQVVRIVGPTGVQAELGASVAGSTVAAVTGAGASILIGAPGAASDAGAAYVVSGLTSGAASINVATGTGVTTIGGLTTGARLGTSVDLGNVGGDASTDILLGAPGVIQGGIANGGAAYVIYGAATPVTSLGLGLNGTNGFVINGANGGGAYSRAITTVANEGDNTGYLVQFLSDINGDGRADILVGSPGVNFSGPTNADYGAAAFIYGQTTAQPATQIYTDFVSTAPVKGFLGNSGAAGIDENSPTAAASGNLNETNGGATTRDFVYTSAFRDFTISAVARTDAGTAFVGFSTLNQQGGIFDGAVLNGTNGYRVVGATSGDRLGFSAAIGDVNSDGIGDLVLGAPGYDAAGTDRGAVYIVYGSTTAPTSSNIDLALLAGTGNATGTIAGLTVARIVGTANGQALGSSVAVADFNGDGRADIATGADGTGSVYVIYGRGTAANQVTADISTPTAGVVAQLTGISPTGQANFHISLASGFDLNGDGKSELLIGATGDNVDGAAYLVFGANPSSQVPNAIAAILEPVSSPAQAALDALIGPSDHAGFTVGAAMDISLPLQMPHDLMTALV